MPTYEYRCPKCDAVELFERKMSDMSQPVCLKCLDTSMSRGPGGGIGVHFKGSGFYETDYKNKEKRGQ